MMILCTSFFSGTTIVIYALYIILEFKIIYKLIFLTPILILTKFIDKISYENILNNLFIKYYIIHDFLVIKITFMFCLEIQNLIFYLIMDYILF